MAKLKTRTIRKKGKPPITFKEGGLHQSTHTPAGQPISEAKMRQALSGALGVKAKKQAQFKKNVLTGRKHRKGK